MIYAEQLINDQIQKKAKTQHTYIHSLFCRVIKIYFTRYLLLLCRRQSVTSVFFFVPQVYAHGSLVSNRFRSHLTGLKLLLLGKVKNHYFKDTGEMYLSFVEKRNLFLSENQWKGRQRKLGRDFHPTKHLACTFYSLSVCTHIHHEGSSILNKPFNNYLHFQ